MGADLDDAQQGYRRAARELVEDDVRRIRRHRGEVDTGARKPAQRCQQVFREGRVIVFGEIKPPLYIKTIDNDGWCSRRIVPRPRIQNAPVIVDRGLGPESADDADGRQRWVSSAPEKYLGT